MRAAAVRPVQLCGVLILAASPCRASDATDGWQHLSALRPAAALKAFGSRSDREARLGRALALIDSQPRTRTNFDQAGLLLRALEQEIAADEVAVMAAYFQARLAHVHQLSPDLDEAIRLYAKAASTDPSHPFAQMAVVKSGILRLYRVGEADRAAVFDELDRAAGGLSDPDAARDLHLALANAAAQWSYPPERSLSHLLAAETTGRLTGKLSGDVLVRIGELSRMLGRTGEARRAYGMFLERFPRDQRASLVRQRMEALP